MVYGYCKNCNAFDELTRHHVLHRAQGGEGLYEQMICRNCHTLIEAATKNFAENCFRSNWNFNGDGSTSQVGIINSGSLSIEGYIGSGGTVAFDSKTMDILLFYEDGTLLPPDATRVVGSTSFVVVGSPSGSTSQVIYFQSRKL